tara:strand:+ start:198 stop:965 length:768 start_codon:yes stop_codon:yes gene_type:complete
MSNTEYSELDKSVETVETVDIESQENQNKKNYYICLTNFFTNLFFTITTIVTLYVLLSNLVNRINRDNQEKGMKYLLKDTNRRQLHYTHDHHPCLHYKYGCCEIYENTGNGNIKIHHFDGRLNHIKKHDAYGSNCPSLLHIAHEHNIHYANTNSCLNSNNTKKCCTVDVETDFIKRNDFNISRNYYYMKFPLIDSKHCPSVSQLLLEYSEHYPCDDRYMYCFWNNGNTLLFIIAVILLLILLGTIKSQCSSRRKI